MPSLLLYLVLLTTACGQGSQGSQCFPPEVYNDLYCRNKLRQIGSLLAARRAGRGLQEGLSGPAFLLQVADQLNDEDLRSFLCPGEPPEAAPDRPPVGSPEFVRMYRELTPKALREDRNWSRYTSYAGPNLKEFPIRPLSREPRLWACDRCAGGRPHHRGIAVLYTSTKVELLKLDELEGYRPGSGGVLVGPGSPDPLLSKMTFEAGR